MLYTISKLLWPLMAPSSFLPVLGIVTFVGALFVHSLLAALIAIIALAALCLACLAPIGILLIAPLEKRFTFKFALAPPYGILAISGGDDYDQNGRVAALVMLSRRFPESRILYSGALNEDEFAKRYTCMGGDASRLIIETKSLNTAENARYSSELVNPQPDQRWLLITSAFHVPRAIGCFRRAGFKVEAYPVSYLNPKPTSNESLIVKNFAVLDLAVKEWVGLVAYRLFDKIDALFPSP